MSETEEYEVERGLLVSFEDQHPRYTYGFEAGMIWQQMQDGAAEIVGTVRVENETTLRRMCEAMSYGWDFSTCSVEGWINIILDRREAESKPKFAVIDGGVKEAT